MGTPLRTATRSKTAAYTPALEYCSQTMTLLLTLLTPEYIVQASDRRLTMPDGTLAEEASNKAVLIERFGCMAYTGLAYCDGRNPTELLMMEAVAASIGSSQPVGPRLRADATRAVKIVRRNLPFAVSRTTFVIAGFQSFEASASMRPRLIVVSNAQTAEDESWAPEAAREFKESGRDLHVDEPLLLHAAGQPVPNYVRAPLRRQLASCLRRSKHPELAARLMSRAIRDVARSNTAVGPNVMSVMIRRESVGALGQPQPDGTFALPTGSFPVNGYELEEANYFKVPFGQMPPSEFVYSPHDGRVGMHFGPAIVTELMQIRGIAFGRVEPPEALEAHAGSFAGSTGTAT